MKITKIKLSFGIDSEYAKYNGCTAYFLKPSLKDSKLAKCDIFYGNEFLCEALLPINLFI